MRRMKRLMSAVYCEASVCCLCGSSKVVSGLVDVVRDTFMSTKNERSFIVSANPKVDLMRHHLEGPIEYGW